MIDGAYPPGCRTRRPRRRRRHGRLLLTAAAALAIGALARHPWPDAPRPVAVARVEPVPAKPRPAVAARSADAAWILDPKPLLGSRTRVLDETPPLGPAFETAPPRTAAATVPVRTAAATVPDAADELLRAARPLPAPQAARIVQMVPLPVPRPAELRQPPARPRLAERPAAPRVRAGIREDAEAERSFFETVFGARPAPEPALAYAALDRDAVLPRTRRPLAPVPDPSMAGGGTAVYDITARTVTLPSGERLEAHSGLGASMDDPRSAHIRMRGATPPGTYDLTEREALFHGVRAIRLNPVGGSAAIHGRDGILAHTYMLGPSGASNGCVSFRDYNRFLQAYLRGEVRRLVVVAGSGDALPRFASRLFGRSER